MTFIVLDILSYSLLVLVHVKTDEYWDKINEKTYIVLFVWNINIGSISPGRERKCC